MIFGLIFCRFFENFCGARPCKKHRFDTVFAMFAAHWPFQKSGESIFRNRFLDAFCGIDSGHPFFIDFDWMLGQFLEVF